MEKEILVKKEHNEKLETKEDIMKMKNGNEKDKEEDKKIYFAVDVGFSLTKYILFKNGKFKEGKIPTAIAPLQMESFLNGNWEINKIVGIGKKDKDKYIKIKGFPHYIGDEAIDREIIRIELVNTLLEYIPYIIYYILKEKENLRIEEINNIYIGTGLALKHFEKNARDLKNKLKKVEIDKEKGEILHFRNVKLCPQGVGCYLDYLYHINKKGEIEKVKKILNGLIIDIGYNTIDIVAIKEGKIEIELCKMLEGKGLIQAINSLRSYIYNKFGIDYSLTKINKIFMKKEMYIRDGVISLKEEIDKILKWFTDLVVNNLLAEYKNTVYGNFLNECEGIIFSGGGARFLNRENIKKKLIENVGNFLKGEIMKNPEFSNARGFLKFLMLKK